MKNTKPTDEKQPFGRIPEDFRERLAKLSHLECHIFTMLTITAVRSVRDPRLGCVDISKSALAREMGIDPKSLRRATKKLFEVGLLDEPNGNRASCPKSWGIMPSYIGPYALPPRASCPVDTTQQQENIGSYESLKGSEDEVKTKVKRKKRDRAAKAAPPHPLFGLVSWDKEKREVHIEQNGYGLLIGKLATLAKHEGLAHRLSDAEWQEGWGRLNGHLMGNPFKTGPKTLPAIVLNWFETDLRRKNNHPQRGKPLAQRIDDKARERMAPDGHSPHSESRTDDHLKRLEIRNFRLNS